MASPICNPLSEHVSYFFLKISRFLPDFLGFLPENFSKGERTIENFGCTQLAAPICNRPPLSEQMFSDFSGFIPDFFGFLPDFSGFLPENFG